jgi:hypothetical protein
VTLLTAAACSIGCAPVRDELFSVTGSPGGRSATTSAAPVTAGNAASGTAGTAASAANGGSGASLDAGSANADAAQDPALNPFADFGWTQTIPGAGSCQAGTFNGNFSCTIDAVLSNETLEGSLSLRLKGATEAQLLSVGGGQLISWDENMKLIVTAPVTGTLDCNTQGLTSYVQPTPSEVMPVDRQLTWLNLSSQPVVTGMLKGTLDPLQQSISGPITLLFDQSPHCKGTFIVRLSP